MSGVMEPRPLMILEAVFRETPRIRAVSVMVMDRGSR